MKTNRKVICSSSAVRYAETLFELNIPKDSEMRNVVKITNPLGEDTSVMRTADHRCSGQSDDSSREEGTGHR
jgi:hypothetical protein